MNYRKEVLRNVNNYLTKEGLLVNGAMGLCGESGEVSEIIKKHMFHGRPLDRDSLIKELGDVRWYLELLCHVLDISMNEVEEENVKKLKLRYPDGFNKNKLK